MSDIKNIVEARDFPVRIKVQQSAKGFSYWEVTVKGDNIEDTQILLDKTIEIAKAKCEDLNMVHA